METESAGRVENTALEKKEAYLTIKQRLIRINSYTGFDRDTGVISCHIDLKALINNLFWQCFDDELASKVTKLCVMSYFAACFATDAIVDDPVGSPPIKGTDAILQRGKEFMANFQTVGLYPDYVSVDNLNSKTAPTTRWS